MEDKKEDLELGWISLILRVAMGSLFAVAAYGKFAAGLESSANSIVGTFKDSVLPSWLVMPYAYLIPFMEMLIAVWLFLGWKLRSAWIFTSFIMVTLAFGMTVAKQFTVAASNYVYVVICCLGLYVSKFDRKQKCCDHDSKG